MKREILFRGKRENGEWVEGNLLTDPDGNHAYIQSGDYIFGPFFEVDPDTVGQYTGFKDCNAVLIFEGDIVRIKDYFYESVGVVSWEKAGIWFSGEDRLLCDNDNTIYLVEVIGNVHDNPELLEEVDKFGYVVS